VRTVAGVVGVLVHAAAAMLTSAKAQASATRWEMLLLIAVISPEM
jgi:hypothetical protein